MTSQDPTEGAQVAKGSTVHLGVKHVDKDKRKIRLPPISSQQRRLLQKRRRLRRRQLTKAAAAKAAAGKAAADKAAAVKAAAEKAAAQAAADQAGSPKRQLNRLPTRPLKQKRRLLSHLPRAGGRLLRQLRRSPRLQVPHRCTPGRLATAPVLTAIATASPASSSR